MKREMVSPLDSKQDQLLPQNKASNSNFKGFPQLLVKPPCKLVFAFLTLGVSLALLLTVLSDKVGLGTYDDKIKFVKYASVPVISVIFTYFHIWLALWMTFYPIKFFGILQIPGTNVGVPGWQGIIPSKAEKMARISVRLMTTKLIDMKAEFRKINPQTFAAQMEGAVQITLESAIAQTADKYYQGMWQNVPAKMKNNLLAVAKEKAPVINERIMHEIQDRMEEIFDMEEFVVSFLVEKRELLVDMFISCGYQELCFIRNSGATMGGIFGFVQMLIWMVWCTDACLDNPPLVHRLVVFPVIGFCVGLLTNWMALLMIFSPIDPVTICGIRFQGLFLTRQNEVAAVYGQMVASHILGFKNIVHTMLKGPNSDIFFEIVDRHMHESLDENAGVIGNTMASWVVGSEQYMQMREDFIDCMNEGLPAAMDLAENYADEALDISGTMCRAMQSLPSRDFERLLHPVFEEDEWKLILIGGVLGVVIGLLQTFFINNHG